MSPTEHAVQRAARHDLVPTVRDGLPFRHWLLEKSGSATTLYVFIEGDGSPWHRGLEPSTDPTPRNPLALELMLATPGPALYVGRPCYFDLHARDPHCDPDVWTFGRYSEAVVASLARVIGDAARDTRARHLTLVGHSGGGTLAVLLAPRLPGVQRVITIGAVLDTTAWTAWHGYEPLAGSLNPVTQPPPPSNIEVIHFAGGRDQTVPAFLAYDALATIGSGELRVETESDHVCCWVRDWPRILAEFPPP